MTRLPGTGERSARRLLAAIAALLIIAVVAVHLMLVAYGTLPAYPLWYGAIGAFAAISTLLAGLVARWVPDRVLRGIAGAGVLGYGLVLALFPLSVPAEGIERLPWMLSASGAATAVALAAGGRMLAGAVVVAGAAAGLGYRWMFDVLSADGVVNDLQALLTGAVICVVGSHILSVGRGLDAAAAEVADAEARESAELGRYAARTRAAVLVRDEVLSTLGLAAAASPEIPRERLAAQAAHARASVSRLLVAQTHEPLTLARAIADEARAFGASFTKRGDPSPAIPALAQETLVAAIRQALGNAARHAPGAAVAVEMSTARSVLRIDIRDDGPGFDPAGVAAEHLGVRQGIVGRMLRIPGGSSDVRSAPGTGTRIRLVVDAPPEGAFDLAGDQRGLRAGLAAIAAVFLGTQIASAVVAAAATPAPWSVHVGLLATALAAAEILRRSPAVRPDAVRTAVVVALAAVGVVAGAALVPFDYASMWFAVALGFVFVALALRGRIRVALAGGAGMVVALVVDGLLSGASPAGVVVVTARIVIIVVIACGILVAARRIERRTARAHRLAVGAVSRESWALAARAEVAARVDELAVSMLPLLDEIASGHAPGDADRDAYARCAQRLREAVPVGDPLDEIVAPPLDRMLPGAS